jgi:hypothetical protein
VVLFPLLCALAAPATAAATGRIVEARYPPSEKPGELVFGVTYRVWIPEGVTRIRGVIVHQHGCGKGACEGGKTAAEDLHWQALARKWDCVLLGPSFEQEDGQNCRLWCDPRNGSRARFLQAMGDLATKSGHPELVDAPWCLWGHSGGGFWASLMMASDPERIVAVWLRSGSAFLAWKKGEIPAPELREAVYEIPFVANPGAKEKDDARFNGAWTGTLEMFDAFRAQGAPAAFAPDPRTGHECGDSRYLAIPYFDACLAARLPAPGASSKTLRPVDSKSGWLAARLGDSAVPIARFPGDPKTASWLPDERVARAWSHYVRTGGGEDATPPLSPTNLKVVTSPDGTATLSWEAAADLESGLRQFVILRDGREIGRIPETPSGRLGRPLFQGLSYHDTPVAPTPAMSFVVAKPSGGAYQVKSINSVGLESPPSAPSRAN